MSEYIVDVTGMESGDYAIAREEIVRCRDCIYRYGCLHLLDNGDGDMRRCHASPDNFAHGESCAGKESTDET